jgi:DNA-binding response OmpR family regulator
MKVLIVEDEQSIAKSLSRGLTEEGFTVDIANDGERGAFLGRTEEYDVIILDLMLPKQNGIEVLQEIRGQKIFTPVIILTAKDSNTDIVNGLNIGADDYLPKPFSFEILLARIRALIRRSTTNETLLELDSLTLDPIAKVVMRTEKEITLSAKEFALLEYMMRHKGAYLSETQILNHVWDYDYDGFSNVVAVHIKNLKTKIDKAFPKEKQLFNSVRGLGYRLV